MYIAISIDYTGTAGVGERVCVLFMLGWALGAV